jgi:molybdopterin converting factor small subunit
MARLILPPELRELAGGASAVPLGAGATTVRAALEQLRHRHPAAYDGVCTELREVRPHVNVFVGREDIRWTGGVDTPVAEDSEVVILRSVSGG